MKTLEEIEAELIELRDSLTMKTDKEKLWRYQLGHMIEISQNTRGTLPQECKDYLQRLLKG